MSLRITAIIAAAVLSGCSTFPINAVQLNDGTQGYAVTANEFVYEWGNISDAEIVTRRVHDYGRCKGQDVQIISMKRITQDTSRPIIDAVVKCI